MADSRNMGELASLTDRARAALGRAAVEITLAGDLTRRVQTALEAPFEPPLNGQQNREEILAAHRRAHRPGMPGKIASDPELQAFILARIESLTLKETVAAVTEAFPADRHVSVSAVSRWWLRTGKAMIAARP